MPDEIMKINRLWAPRMPHHSLCHLQPPKSTCAAMAISMRSNYAGAQLQQVGRSRGGAPARARAQPAMASKKLNSYDDQWAKGGGQTGK